MNNHTINFTIENDDGDEVECSLPAKNEICHRCNGFGTHVHSAIDGNGITASEWAEMEYDDPDFAEDYFSGTYDVTCEECNGDKVIATVDEVVLNEEQKKIYSIWSKQQDERAEAAYYDHMERNAERRMMGY